MVVILKQHNGPDRAFRIKDRASAEKLRGLRFDSYEIHADNWQDKMPLDEYVRTQVLEPGLTR